MHERLDQVELLIPTKNDLLGTLRLVGEAKVAARHTPIKITVSVSDPSVWWRYNELLSSEPFVELLPSAGPLGLYENFRRLVKYSQADWVSICADDDSIPPDFITTVHQSWPSTVKLIVPPIELRPYERVSQTFGAGLHGSFVKPARELDRIDLSKSVWPTWFFGLWRGEWIRKEFPEEDFDWLDCALLHKTIMQNGIAWAMEAQPLVCGYDPSRPSHSVSGSLHNIEGWKSFCRKFVANESLLEQTRWRWIVERSFEKTCRRLNALI